MKTTLAEKRNRQIIGLLAGVGFVVWSVSMIQFGYRYGSYDAYETWRADMHEGVYTSCVWTDGEEC